EECLIGVDDLTIVCSDKNNSIRTGIKYGSIVLFARPQRFLGRGQSLFRRLAVADVFDKADEVKRPSQAVALQRDGRLCPEQASILADIALFERFNAGPARDSLHYLRACSPVLRCSDLPGCEAGDLLRR